MLSGICTDGSPGITKTPQLALNGKVVHLAFWRQRQRLRVYANADKVWDLPRAKQAMLDAAKRAKASGVKVSLTLSDSFCVARFRDEFLNRESFASLLEAKVLGKEHRHRHNHLRPHSSLDYQTPAEYAAGIANRSDGGCAPPNPALLAAAAFGGTKGASAPKAATHINQQPNQKHQKLS